MQIVLDKQVSIVYILNSYNEAAQLTLNKPGNVAHMKGYTMTIPELKTEVDNDVYVQFTWIGENMGDWRANKMLKTGEKVIVQDNGPDYFLMVSEPKNWRFDKYID